VREANFSIASDPVGLVVVMPTAITISYLFFYQEEAYHFMAGES